MDKITGGLNTTMGSSYSALKTVASSVGKINNGHYNIISRIDTASRIMHFAEQIFTFCNADNGWYKTPKVEKTNKPKGNITEENQSSMRHKDIYEGMSFSEKLAMIKSLGNDAKLTISPAQEKINQLSAELSSSKANCDDLKDKCEHLEQDKQELRFQFRALENKEKANLFSQQI